MLDIRCKFDRRESISNLPLFSSGQLKLLLRHLCMTRPLTSEGSVLEGIPLCSLLSFFIEMLSSRLGASELFCLQLILPISGMAFFLLRFFTVHAVENLIGKVALGLCLLIILTKSAGKVSGFGIISYLLSRLISHAVILVLDLPFELCIKFHLLSLSFVIFGLLQSFELKSPLCLNLLPEVSSISITPH